MTKRRSRGKDVHGILLLDKPLGRTSNGTLQDAKRLYDATKAGHTGSLDPLATGMLPICFGAATRISSYLLDAGKSYCVTARLGEATASGDAETSVVESQPVPILDDSRIGAVLDGYLGQTRQTPPMHSALRHAGRRLYKLARKGIEVPREARVIQIGQIALEVWEPPKLRFSVTCSKGTYIRTLVEDIARDLGTVAHTAALRRTAVGPYREHQMVTLESLERSGEGGQETLQELLQPVDSALRQIPRVDLTEDLCARLRHGQSIPADSDWPLSSVRLYDPKRVFFGIGEITATRRLIPRRIFPGLTSWS